MFKAIAAVSREITQAVGDEPAKLDVITRIVSGVTAIDEIHFVKFESTPDNPIWGSFQKWQRQPTVYTRFSTVVEVRYASHLDEAWRRFVVCKELCHALEADEGTHSVTPEAMDRLVATFSKLSKTGTKNFNHAPSEFLAELGALELMCPAVTRRKIIAANEENDVSCAKHVIPSEYSLLVFDEALVLQTETFMTQ